jgi:hypothetical protein
MVKLSWVTYSGKKYKKNSQRSHCNRRPAQVKKYEDFLKWSHGNEQPAQVKIQRFFKMVSL